MLVYCPAVAAPVAVQVVLAPAASVGTTHTLPLSWSSVTTTFVTGTLLVFVTTYVHVTVEPTATCAPGALA
jgi:hypothetical protein